MYVLYRNEKYNLNEPMPEPPDLSIFNATALGFKQGDVDNHPLYYNFSGNHDGNGENGVKSRKSGNGGNGGAQKETEYKFKCPHCDKKYVL